MESKVSFKTESDMETTMEMIAQQVIEGKLTPKQGDVGNTSAKQILKMKDLKLKYLSFFYTVHKKAVDGGGATVDMVFKKLPSFFTDDAAAARQVAGQEQKKLK